MAFTLRTLGPPQRLYIEFHVFVSVFVCRRRYECPFATRSCFILLPAGLDLRSQDNRIFASAEFLLAPFRAWREGATIVCVWHAFGAHAIAIAFALNKHGASPTRARVSQTKHGDRSDFNKNRHEFARERKQLGELVEIDARIKSCACSISSRSHTIERLVNIEQLSGLITIDTVPNEQKRVPFDRIRALRWVRFNVLSEARREWPVRWRECE